LAIRYLEEEKNKETCEVFNLGTGTGNTVLEAIAAFEQVSGQKLSYQIGPRRAGDVVAIYANNDRARSVLGWQTRYTLADIMNTAWIWEQKLRDNKTVFGE
jgi:UDP-glucose 4-epimerase